MTDLPTASPEGAPSAAAGAERLTPGQRLSLGLYTAMERVAMRWPERPARALFKTYGTLGYRFMPKVRATVARNRSPVEIQA